MDIMGIDIFGVIIPIIIAIIAIVIIYKVAKAWVKIYNKFVYWKTRLDRKFADIDVIMQRRLDMLSAFGQIAKKYSIHEYKTIKDTIEARSGWTKDTPLDEKVKNTQSVENNFAKIQAVFEKYPKVKADRLYVDTMTANRRIERKLGQYRLSYNRVAQKYNERVQRFPRSLVAKVHKFTMVSYLTLGNNVNQDLHEQFNPKEIFEDQEK